MYTPYSEEPGLNRFLFISVLLHALLFFALPRLSSMIEPEFPHTAGGGIIQVMHVESSVSSRPSPITNPASQSTAPKVTEPRPLPEQTPQEEASAEPGIPEVEIAAAEHSSPAIPTTESPGPEVELVESEPELPQVLTEDGRGEVLTSAAGPEVVVEPEPREEVMPPPEPLPVPEDRPGGQSSSGSGTGGEGSEDHSGEQESGSGTAPSAPPAPAPPPSGNSLYLGGGSPLYPKNAEHDGVEGTVQLLVEVSSNGQLQEVILESSSGDQRLDLQAQRYIEGLWSFQPQPYDYSMAVEVVFKKEQNRFATSHEFGETKWLNAP